MSVTALLVTMAFVPDPVCATLSDPAEREEVEVPRPELPEPDRSTKEFSLLEERWELVPGTKQGTFNFRPHNQNYFLPVRYSTSPNEQPVSPRTGAAPEQDLDNVEAKFQLSFKIKTLEGLFKNHADLWFAFTQQSNWQIYNADRSRPFRETNYEPEIVLTFATDYRVLGLRGRLLNLGIVHQSNGQSEPSSRGWNRAYVQLGFERDRFAVLVRPWYRFPEDDEDDDNEDIDEFLGYGDLQAVYKREDHTWSLLLRSNLASPHHGSLKLDYSFPGVGQMKGYVQLFTGHGESLIDYNHRQTTIGLGLILTDIL